MRIVTVLVLVLLLSAPVMASQVEINAVHELEVEMSGTWNFESSTQMPSVESDIGLDGEGDARIRSYLSISERITPVNTWWDLF